MDCAPVCTCRPPRAYRPSIWLILGLLALCWIITWVGGMTASDLEGR